MHLRFCFALALLFAVSTCALAQKPGGGGSSGGGGGSTGPTGSGGNQPGFSTALSAIPQAAERQVEESIHLQLLNSQSVPVQDTFSNRDGMVTFHNVSPGSYCIKMDGSDIKDATTDTFVIYPNDRMHMEWIHVTPKDNPQTANVPGAGPMVSASDLSLPPKAKSEMDKGMDAFAKGNFKKAEEKLEKATEIYPKYARAWNNLGVVRIRENNKDGARTAFQKSIEADSKFSSGYLNLARLSMMEKNLPEADSFINRALSFDPNNAEALVLLAKEQLDSGQYDKALLNARKVHNLPHDHWANIHLIAGQALLKENRNAEAMQEFELFLKEDPGSPNAASVRSAMAQIQAKLHKPVSN